MKNVVRTTLVLGASPNPDRYSFLAIEFLCRAGIPVLALGAKRSSVHGVEILTAWEELPNTPIETITLYIGAARQPLFYAHILSAQPARIIFNPGTENPELAQMAQDAGIQVVHACTLVMLRTNLY